MGESSLVFMGFLAISTRAMRAFILENRVSGEFPNAKNMVACVTEKRAGRDT